MTFRDYFTPSLKSEIVQKYKVKNAKDVRSIALIQWLENRNSEYTICKVDEIKTKFVNIFMSRAETFIGDYLTQNGFSEKEIEKIISDYSDPLKTIVEEMYDAYDDDDRKGCEYLDWEILQECLTTDKRLPFYTMHLNQ